MREDLAHAREVPTIVVFYSPLFSTGERCMDLCVVVVFEGRFFLKNSTRHPASIDEKTNRMRRHTIFRYYSHHGMLLYHAGRYYSRGTIVVTIVVTTVAMKNRMPTHAIFFLIY